MEIIFSDAALLIYSVVVCAASIYAARRDGARSLWLVSLGSFWVALYYFVRAFGIPPFSNSLQDAQSLVRPSLSILFFSLSIYFLRREISDLFWSVLRRER